MNIEFPSKLVSDAVNEISNLPGIGKKTALRLVFFLLKEDESTTNSLSLALKKLRSEIKYCKECFNISDTDTCGICKSHSKDKTLICVVETPADLIAVENTAQFNGIYHVLGGVISPIDGISPSDIKIEALINRIAKGEIKEVIFALSSTMEADTTVYYISKKIKEFAVQTSTIARGIPVGGELEYTDEITLGRSISQRISYK